MRERTFRKPSAREVLLDAGVELAERINERAILRLINSGTMIPAGQSYEDAVKAVEGLSFNETRFVLFPSRFRVTKEKSDYGIKSLDDLVKIDSQAVLRAVSGEETVPHELTKEFAERHRIWPYTLIKQAMKTSDLENPPIGYYWVGNDNRVRATTWIRGATAAEMIVMQKTGDFYGEVLDKKPYGRNLRVKVESRTEEGKYFEFTLSRLPMHKRGDLRQFSDWINLSHNSADPDASYRGEEHEKRKNPVVFWSASTIFSFYEAMAFVSKHPGWKQFRINPFSIPTNEEMADYIDNLRLRSLILDENDGKLNLEVLNKTEIDKMSGARTILRGYDNCWHHWGKKNLGYLYRKNSVRKTICFNI